MKLDQIHIAYFIGIGGIGMSALARWFKNQGCSVGGYDKSSTELTDELMKEGIGVHFDDDVANIPPEVWKDKSRALIIYTPAIPADNKEFEHLKKGGFQIRKRSQVLGAITEGMFTIAVAGTHGKTTTCSMIAHILKESGRNVLAFMGGISSNYGSNLILNDPDGEDPVAVVEADEFDRSFLTLHPNLAVVTSADPDHLDIYGDRQTMLESFKEFLEKVSDKRQLFIQERIATELIGPEDILATRYSLEKGDVRAQNIKIQTSSFVFDIVFPDKIIRDVMLNVPGFHNVENALAAAAVALNLGTTADDIKRALETYQGVKRRFEYIIKSRDLVFIDDYAHHPNEVSALLNSLRALYPGKKITAVFQPHLYSRTQDFAWDFAASLGLADELILMDIYPAREKPIPGVTSNIILDKVDLTSKMICSPDQLLEEIQDRSLEVLVTLGAGNIDEVVGPIKRIISSKGK